MIFFVHTCLLHPSNTKRKLHEDRKCGFFLLHSEQCMEVGVVVVVVQSLSHVRLCDPMDCSTPGFSVFYYLPELAQTHVHWVSDVIQPSQLLSFPSSLAFNLSQHQGLFQWIGSSHWVAKVLKLQFQHQSFQWIFRVYFLQEWLVWSPKCPKDSQQSSPAPQFESTNSLALSLLYGPTLTSLYDYWKSHSFAYMDLACQSDFSVF